MDYNLITADEIEQIYSSGGYGTETADKAFDGNTSTAWNSFNSGDTYVTIKLKKPAFLKKLKIKGINLITGSSFGLRGYNILGSNDNINFKILYSGSHPNSGGETGLLNIDGQENYIYYKFESLNSWYQYKRVYFTEIEFYVEYFKRKTILKTNNKIYAIHEQEDNGENLSKNVVNVTASGGTTPQKTIDGNTTISQSYSWYSTNLPSAWIKYEFNQPIHIDKIKILSVYFSGYEAIRNFQIEGSNTGDFTGEEVVIYRGVHPNDTTQDFVTYSFRNSGKYKFYRINVLDIYVGNGANNLSIVEVEFYSNLTELIQVPKYSVNNFVKYGVNNIGFDGFIFNKNYILQDGVSENADGLWVQEIDRKPLSIKFE